MDKNECLAIVKLVNGSWNRDVDDRSIKTLAEAYWEYLEDVPYKETRDAVRGSAIAGDRWPPRPGELRVRVLAVITQEPLPPEPEEAWTILQSISKEIYSGSNNYTKTHPVLERTIKQLGTSATGLTTNADRAMFIELYTTARAEYLLYLYNASHE